MQRINRWWAAAVGAVLIATIAGVGAVMAQETPQASPTTTTQQTPTAEATSSAGETPSAGDDDDADGDEDEDAARGSHAGGCGKFVDAEALAEFLGITEEQLRAELQADGATLASVAQAHGQSRDALKTFLTQQATARLAEEVAEGDLTQDEADEKLAEYTANLDELIDRSPPAGRGFKPDRESKEDESSPSSGSSLSGVGVS